MNRIFIFRKISFLITISLTVIILIFSLNSAPILISIIHIPLVAYGLIEKVYITPRVKELKEKEKKRDKFKVYSKES